MPKYGDIEDKTMKPFRAHLLEQEDTYEYKLCSVENIHTDEMQSHIRLALGKHGLLELIPNGVQTQINSANKNQLTDYPFLPVYVVKVVMSSAISSWPAVQSISLFTRIKDDKLKFFDKDDKIVMDGADGEQHAHPVEVDSKSAQSEVGDAHAASLVSDLMKGLATSRGATMITREVYEGLVTDHHGVSPLMKNPSRGFYIVETHAGGANVVGPYKRCPDNYNFVSNMAAIIAFKVVSQNSIGSGLFETEVSYHEADQQADPDESSNRLQSKPMTVKLIDQDTGKEYSVEVRAESDESARRRAIEIIAARTGMNKDRFLSKDPSS